MNHVYVRLIRPEGYEDVCNDLVIEDTGINVIFEPEDFTDQVIASMQTADLNGDMAEDVQREIGRQRDVIRKSNSYADHLGMSLRDIKRERDDLLAALDRLSFAAACRDNTSGDPIRLIEVKAELAAASEAARAAIAKVKK